MIQWFQQSRAESQQIRASLLPESRAKLLRLTVSRVLYSVKAIPFVAAAMLAAMLWVGANVLPLLVWGLAYAVAALYAVRLGQQFDQAQHSLSATQLLETWTPRITRIAAVHGLALSLMVVVIGVPGNHEMDLLAYATTAAILAANASHQTPVFSCFRVFLICTWGPLILLCPLILPTLWLAALPLCVIFLLTMLRHGLQSHLFFVRQVKLEQDSQELATKYRAAKDEAELALLQKNQFISTASHDLRQPIQAMSFLLETIGIRNQDAQLQPALQDMRSALRSVQLMFDSLLDLSRIDAGVMDVNLQPVNLTELVTDVSRLFASEARAHGLRLTMHPPQGACWAMVDAVLMRRSLVNLVQNALRYTPHGGVLLGIRRRGAEYWVEVWDTGVGIALAEQAQIYSPYYRNQLAWDRDRTGLGLGLAVVERCAALMDAKVGLQSVLGKGSRFWLAVPVADRPAAAGVVAHGQRGVWDGAEPTMAALKRLSGTCLLVEDDLSLQTAWRQLLSTWGLDVRCASTAQEALDIVHAGFVPDAILCDYRLRSGESGFEIFKTLLQRCPSAAGAMVSGEFNAPELAQAQDEGYLVLRKPVEVATLYQLLDTWLAARQPAQR